MWALFKNGERVNEFYWNSYEKAFQAAFNYEHNSIAYDGANQLHLKEDYTIKEVKITMFALFYNGKQITESRKFETGAYADAFSLVECYEVWNGAKLLKEGYTIEEVKE